MEERIVFNRVSENLIEISWIYSELENRYKNLQETDRIIWKQLFIDWANEFEEIHGDVDWNDSEETYREVIYRFAVGKMLLYAGMKKKIIVGRNINEITLNPYEWLLDDKGDIMCFETKEDAKKYLLRNGFNKADLLYMKFEEAWL